MSPSALAARLEERLRAAVRAARGRAREAGRPVLAWACARVPPVDPIAAFAHGAGARERMLLASPGRTHWLVGIGSAWTVSTRGEGRFAGVGAAWQGVVRDAAGEGCLAPDEPAQAGPVLLGGFAFAPEEPAGPEWEGFGAGCMILPRICVTGAEGENWAVLATMVAPDGPSKHQADQVTGEGLRFLEGLRDQPPACGRAGAAAPARAIAIEERPSPGAWKTGVAAASRAVGEGLLRKVVLARSVRVRGGPFDPVAALRRLDVGYPGCTLFAMANADRCFLGATPERLVRARGGEVSAMALAGTAPRGSDEDEDRRLGAMLLASGKDRLEHAAVVDLLREDLAGACHDVSVEDGPGLVRLANAQHLCTMLRARMEPGTALLDLVARLHPTPAVGGVPRAEALAWIRGHEGFERGWYAGPVGWLDQRGEGEFAVGIRSALLRADLAVLYAGCGIVAGSDPDAEYAESRLKLAPMMSALGIKEEPA